MVLLCTFLRLVPVFIVDVSNYSYHFTPLSGLLFTYLFFSPPLVALECICSFNGYPLSSYNVLHCR